MTTEAHEKALKKVNGMAAEAKAYYDRYGRTTLYNALFSQLLGAINLLSTLTGKQYIINADGTITEK